jgi:WD40 repeat protein
MRRILRQFRRPVVTLATLYLSGVGILAAVLPYRPARVVPRGDFHQMLVGFSPDGRRLATGPRLSHLSVVNPRRGSGLPDDDPFEIWDVAGPLPVRVALSSRTDDDDFLFAFGRNPEGRRFFWRFVDDPAFRRIVSSPALWGADAHELEWRGRLPTINTAGCQYSPDGRFAALFEPGLSAGIVVEWPTGRPLIRLPAMTQSVAFLPDGRTVVSAQINFSEPDQQAHYQVSRADLSTGRTTAVAKWDPAAKANGGLTPWSLLLSPDGRWLIDLWEPRASGKTDSGVVVWDATNGEKHLSLSSAQYGKLARNGRTLAAVYDTLGQGDPRLMLFDLETGATCGSCINDSGSEERTPEVYVNPDGEILAVTIPDPHQHPLESWPKLRGWLERAGIRLSPSESLVVLVQSSDGRDLARLPLGPSHLFNLGEHADAEPAIAFSPGGRRLAVLADDAIRIWDLPIRRPWALILSCATIPPVAFGLLVITIRRWRSPRPATTAA